MPVTRRWPGWSPGSTSVSTTPTGSASCRRPPKRTTADFADKWRHGLASTVGAVVRIAAESPFVDRLESPRYTPRLECAVHRPTGELEPNGSSPADRSGLPCIQGDQITVRSSTEGESTLTQQGPASAREDPYRYSKRYGVCRPPASQVRVVVNLRDLNVRPYRRCRLFEYEGCQTSILVTLLTLFGGRVKPVANHHLRLGS